MKYFTVGPSQTYPQLSAIVRGGLRDGIASLSHRSALFDSLYQETVDSLRKLLRIPKDHQIFFVSSGTECMERIIQNMVASRSHHFVNGAFSKRFFQTAVELRKNPTKNEVPMGEAFDSLTSSIPDDAELICFTQNETSAGVALDMNDIYAVKKRNPHALIALDIVSSAPYVDITFDTIDACFFSIQKGFGLPAGLAVMVVSDRALQKSKSLEKKGCSTGSYHSFSSLLSYAQKHETPETPNVLGIYLLGKVAQSMCARGIDVIRKETEQKSHLIETCVAGSTRLNYLCKKPQDRSKTVHVLQVRGGSSELINFCKTHGFVLSGGYGTMKKDFVRIANFSSHSQKDVKALLKIIRKFEST